MSVKTHQKVELEIGGQVVESQSGEAMYIAQSLNNSSDGAKLKAMCASTCLEGCCSLDLFSARNEYALPLIRLPRHDSRFKFTRELKQMIHGDVEEIVGFGSVYHV
jgi:hypothetical protein